MIGTDILGSRQSSPIVPGPEVGAVVVGNTKLLNESL